STNDLKPRSLITFRCTRREASAPDGRQTPPERGLATRSSARCGEFLALAAEAGGDRRGDPLALVDRDPIRLGHGEMAEDLHADIVLAEPGHARDDVQVEVPMARELGEMHRVR